METTSTPISPSDARVLVDALVSTLRGLASTLADAQLAAFNTQQQALAELGRELRGGSNLDEAMGGTSAANGLVTQQMLQGIYEQLPHRARHRTCTARGLHRGDVLLMVEQVRAREVNLPQ